MAGTNVLLPPDAAQPDNRAHKSAAAVVGEETCLGSKLALQRHLEQHTTDILVIDWNLAETDGLSLPQWTEEHRNGAPVLLLTLLSTPEVILTAFRAGAADYTRRNQAKPHQGRGAMRSL